MKYFFNLSGAIDDFDLVGHEFPNLMAARLAAARFAGEYLRDRPGIIWHGEKLRMEVTDANHLLQFVITICTANVPE